ncbi:hypothetical protein [Paenibacillus sacheonensis]|uniref:Uncharacterized protein n=1 Tax=Paenibacillus sacheonensis TaxID=742054 RepID=A0A7X4YLG5_9BACL|nr:hypothetical protein [Paenibacillus sacheonensis]MBM7563814.1 hypothetical protein [Paenibacillus sacheonensis]NBC67836.1 hypothetical protein [Paenibacillus sacheonensis]
MIVTEAHVRRAADRDGLHCAEVEVHTSEAQNQDLLAYFGQSADNDFDMIAVVNNDARSDIDWYDNNMHQAFTDITDDLFDTPTMKTDWGERESFKEQVLSYPGVRADIRRLMDWS